MKLLRSDREKLTLQPPSHRTDIAREIDLVEEVGRIHGYHKIKAQLPYAPARVETIAPEERSMIEGVLVVNENGSLQLVNDAARACATDPDQLWVLVLDDYHAITDPGTHAAVSFQSRSTWCRSAAASSGRAERAVPGADRAPASRALKWPSRRRIVARSKRSVL